MGMVEAVEAKLPGETVKFVFQAQRGLNPSWRYFLVLLNMFNDPRIVAVTDQRVAVFSAGQLRWERDDPKFLVFQLHPDTPVTRSRRAFLHYRKYDFGQEKLWVHRNGEELIASYGVPRVSSGPGGGGS